MSVMLANLFHRANKCRFACFLKLMLAVGFYYAIHLAIYHQADVSPYPFILLVALIGIIAVLALASHLNCQFSNIEKTEGID
ncbi:MAG: hypothetical protein WBN57_02730 [Gammaproteobacteria bacterium]